MNGTHAPKDEYFLLRMVFGEAEIAFERGRLVTGLAGATWSRLRLNEYLVTAGGSDCRVAEPVMRQ